MNEDKPTSIANVTNKTALEIFPQTETGLQGFVCPKSGREVPFAFCITDCKSHCKPLPVLLALFGQMHPRDDYNTFHVTESLNPPQQVFLSRTKPYYVDADSLLDMNVGTAWHSELENSRHEIYLLGLKDDYIMEKTMKETMNIFVPSLKKDYEITLSGTPDLVIPNTSTIWDYKVMKYYYSFKFLTEGKWTDNAYMWQLNIYRTIWYPWIENLKLYCYLKDWKYNFPEMYDVDHAETINVPIIDKVSVKARLWDSLAEHIETRETGKPRKCKEGEMWKDRLRCKNYCSVSRICPQAQEYFKRIKNGKEKMERKDIRRNTRKRRKG